LYVPTRIRGSAPRITRTSTFLWSKCCSHSIGDARSAFFKSHSGLRPKFGAYSISSSESLIASALSLREEGEDGWSRLVRAQKTRCKASSALSSVRMPVVPHTEDLGTGVSPQVPSESRRRVGLLCARMLEITGNGWPFLSAGSDGGFKSWPF
jgi:hypothetical protein